MNSRDPEGIRQKIAAEILEQNHYDAQVTEAVRQVKERCSDRQTRLAETVSLELKKEPVGFFVFSWIIFGYLERKRRKDVEL